MNPDHHLEDFWMTFKTSMINFYTRHSLIKRPIDIWCDRLNQLQSRKKYNVIQRLIQEYMSLYSIDVMRFGNGHEAHLLETNIKRWNRLPEITPLTNTPIMVLFHIYYRHYDKIQDIKTFQDIYQQVELFLITGDYYPLIQFAIDYEYPSILDSLYQIIDVDRIITDNYDLDIPKGMSGRKLIDAVKCQSP